MFRSYDDWKCTEPDDLDRGAERDWNRWNRAAEDARRKVAAAQPAAAEVEDLADIAF